MGFLYLWGFFTFFCRDSVIAGSEQTGAALALAEVFVRMNKVQVEEFIPELRAITADTSAAVRRGFLELFDCMPQAMKMEFVPFIDPFFPAMLMGMACSKDVDEDTGFTGSLALVQCFGDQCPDLLSPAFESYMRSLYAVPRQRSGRSMPCFGRRP